MGIATVDLITLEDQYKHDKHFELKQYKSYGSYSSNVYTTEANIHLVLQLVYSKVNKSIYPATFTSAGDHSLINIHYLGKILRGRHRETRRPNRSNLPRDSGL